MARRAETAGLDVVAVSRLCMAPGRMNGILLGFASWQPHEITAAVDRLGSIIAEL
ncbi:hypothetical protein [Methylobacterium nodulans]|uniref:hypothetical protein n=1 Tax=Methylobacterium nodulans TaxID=114616 RepID=UPI0003163C54|nr:hypothetical protein [Methylobacterium nodulans]